jgi:hypothetical protein
MNKKIFLSTLLILSIAVASCRRDDSAVNTTESNQIVPLKIGNQWVYENVYYDTLGRQTREVIDTVTIAKDTTIAGEKWFRLVGSVGYSFDVTNRTNGYSYYFSGAILQYKYPVALNERYQTFVATPNDTMLVSSLNAATTTPAGTFTAYKYDRYVPGRATVRQTSWVTPNQGIIKEELYAPNGVVLSRAQLRRIALK